MSEFRQSPTQPCSEVSDSEFWKKCAQLRSELAVPGFWSSLEENCQQWADEISVSPFWKLVTKNQPKWSNEFSRITTGALLASPILPKFQAKCAQRIKTKSLELASSKTGEFEFDKVWSLNGPPVPKLNDLVRARVECQFLDGVEFFADRIEKLASENQIVCTRQREGRLEGYFAQHFYFEQQVFFRFGGGHQATEIKCEVQIATALTTRIWDESHKVYEQWRGRRERRDDWQWNPKDPRFVARQLGHMIHLADGLLVQLRDTTINEPTKLL